LDALFAITLLTYWHRYGTVQKIFSHELWDIYVFLKHWSEVAILGLMLYILQSRFVAAARGGYEAVPDNDSEPNEKTNLVV
jgi:uncharacterized membrane protein YkvI